jgi:hypothetical protein
VAAQLTARRRAERLGDSGGRCGGEQLDAAEAAGGPTDEAHLLAVAFRRVGGPVGRRGGVGRRQRHAATGADGVRTIGRVEHDADDESLLEDDAL